MRDYVTTSMECCKENASLNAGCDFNSSCLYAKGLEGKVLMKQCPQAFAFCEGESRTECGVRQQDDKDFRTVLSDTVVKQCSQALTFDEETVFARTECGATQQGDKDFRTVLSDSESDSARLGFSATHQKQPRKMSRRNERERQRVRMVNMGFANLRNLVPDGRNNKKMSKVETLRSAMEYIRQLKELVDEHDAVNAALSSAFPRAQVHFPPPSYSYESDGSSNPMSPEEEELLDFPLWF